MKWIAPLFFAVVAGAAQGGEGGRKGDGLVCAIFLISTQVNHAGQAPPLFLPRKVSSPIGSRPSPERVAFASLPVISPR